VLERLDADGVHRWVELAFEGLGRHREEIDALNVFPVPDGDTGTNLFLTFEAALGTLRDSGDSGGLQVMLASAAHGLLLGARGNSGIIMSELMRGFSETFGALDPSATAAEREALLTAALARAADCAYAAVADPAEGTILSVARAASDAAASLPAGSTLTQQVTTIADAAAVALAHTPLQLEVLARAGVVDAGGRGLVVVLEALVEAVTGVRRDPGPASLPVPWDVHELDEGGGAYEVMYLLDAGDEDAAGLRVSLAERGDSVVVVGGSGLWNIHVHTDDVGAAIEAGMTAGRPYRIRVTDLRQDAADRRSSSRILGRAVVAVAHGAGTAALLDASGATVVRATAKIAPSTAEILEAIHRAGRPEIVVLPSDSDIRPVAEAAAEKARADGIRISVVPTRSIVQSLAAMAVHDATARFDDDVVAMTRAAGATHYGGVSIASREAMTTAGACQVGDVLGIVAGDIVEIGESVEEVAVRVLGRLLSSGGELVTLVRGADADVAVGSTIARRVRRAHPGVEIVVHDGGQPLWPLILGVE